MRYRIIAVGQPLAGCFFAAALVAPLSAMAQTAPTDRIDAIERQIGGMQSELKQLRGSLGEARAQLRQAREAATRARQDARDAAAAQSQASAAAARAQAVAAAPPPPPPAVPATPPGPHVAQTSGNRFGLESADGRNSIYLTGRLHFDVGDYLDYHPQSKAAAVQNLNSGVNARRARLGITGKFANDWAYSLIYDFGGSSDSSAGATGSGIQSAMITYNGLNKGPLPLAFDLGYMDTPFTLQEATSSNDLLFVERASIQAVATNIFANDFRSALGVRSNNDRYWAGMYLTGPQSGAVHTAGEQYGAFGRATYQLLQSPEYSLHLGGDVGALLKPPTASGIQTITLSDRPELRVDPTSILSTGALGTAAHPVDGAEVYGVEGAASYRNFFVEGEYYHVDVDRRGLANNGFDGGYIEGSWVLTGEQRKYAPAAGAYTNPVPDHPFAPWDDDYGLGAWELVGRFSTISLNDNFAPGVAPAATSNAVGGGRQDVYGVGLNWYPNANIRFMFDYLHGSIDKRFSTAAGGGAAGTTLGTPVGGNFDAVVMRTQFAF
ncbi:MAG TPA: porin [Stellaceae bacterium]|jgi:phosphate-selective porin OprO/OprP|nr:porin [Stellaceae bacterium]